MKRILVLLSVVALMVMMMVVTVAPAFAARPAGHPTPAPPQAYDNPAGDVTTCTVDPVCRYADVGAHHFEEGFGFPHGQAIFLGV
jgi:hypothetical protein